MNYERKFWKFFLEYRCALVYDNLPFPPPHHVSKRADVPCKVPFLFFFSGFVLIYTYM